ncbi:flagellar motor protein [Candidatus Formimonas warabiya]|uniref:Motility protein A n=1 Tax=Formimonas warabiya TaxID=1761012 RepID=A0A3G1KWU8_FORW1|nr:flagellar motor protein [Candidatus Formimonas warabiya]ATW26968.1 motility protein A [Candidatus Formimonas warabiya]
MDISTPLGILLGFGCIALAFVLDGGHLNALFSKTAALIVFGGTIGATMASHTMKEIARIPSLVMKVIKKEQNNTEEIIQYLVTLSGKARAQGLLSLEAETNSENLNKFDPLMKDCLELAVDGTEAEVFREIIENKIELSYMVDKKNAGIFEVAGGYAPTLGIIGTVMGLVHVLSNLSEPDKLGPAIAVAFIATFYGLSSANLFWLPISYKLKGLSAQKRLVQELIMEGTLAIQGGENPLTLERKLKTFLIERTKEKTSNTMKEREANEAA